MESGNLRKEILEELQKQNILLPKTNLPIKYETVRGDFELRQEFDVDEEDNEWILNDDFIIKGKDINNNEQDIVQVTPNIGIVEESVNETATEVYKEENSDDYYVDAVVPFIQPDYDPEDEEQLPSVYSYKIKQKINLPQPILTHVNIEDNGQYSPNMFDTETGDLLPEGTTSDAQYIDQVNVNVPQTVVTNPLETLTNKRLDQEITYTVSDLMNDSNNNAGITKDSTFIVDVPEPIYPTVTFNTINSNITNTSLGSLTSNTSEYFSRESLINTNIYTIYARSKFTYKIGGTSGTSRTISFTKSSSNQTININKNSFNVRLRYDSANHKVMLTAVLTDDEADGSIDLIADDYYYKGSTFSSYNNTVVLYHNNNELLYINMEENDTTIPNYCYINTFFYNSILQYNL